jgi:hypothetical protein
MIDPRFVILASLFNLIGSLCYARLTVKGLTQPNRITWLLWAVAPMIAVAGELSAGVGLTALMTFMVGFGPLVIFCSSFVNRNAYWKLAMFDWFCGGLSVAALVGWQLAGIPQLAIGLSIAADALAAIPTITKAYRLPESESGVAFLGGLISATITLLTIHHWNFATYAFPAYLVVLTALLLALIYRPARRRAAARLQEATDATEADHPGQQP